MRLLPEQQERTQATVRRALERWPDLTMLSGFNLNGCVLLEQATRAGYRGRVVFIDTGYHFPETLQTRERLAERYSQLEFVTLSAQRPDDRAFERNADACCAARKVAPLEAYLAEARPSALLSARSREQNEYRRNLNPIEEGSPARVNPLLEWTRLQLETFARVNRLPVNSLYWDGFLSVGCAPCTRAVRPGEDARAGRWSGQPKTECGLWT